MHHFCWGSFQHAGPHACRVGLDEVEDDRTAKNSNISIKDAQTMKKKKQQKTKKTMNDTHKEKDKAITRNMETRANKKTTMMNKTGGTKSKTR